MGMTPAQTPRARPSDRRRRTIVRLLTFGAILYGLIFGAIYLWSSGFDVMALLKKVLGDTSETAAEPLPGSALEEASHTLPPLDDIPLDEPQSALDPLVPVPPSEPSTDPLPPVPPVPGVVMLTRMTPIKCWDSRGFEQDVASCDPLHALARRAEVNLALLEACRTEILGAGAMGTLALYAEADFIRNRMTFWPGIASTLRHADRVADCLTERWREPRFSELPHRFERYRLKASVRFEGAYHAAPSSSSSATPAVITASQAERLENAVENAREVAVARDRVRVRKAPVDGEIIGFISTGRRVKLLQVTDEWCLVKTKRGNVGWMVCWGLDLSSEGDTDEPSQAAKKNQ